LSVTLEARIWFCLVCVDSDHKHIMPLFDCLSSVMRISSLSAAVNSASAQSSGNVQVNNKAETKAKKDSPPRKTPPKRHSPAKNPPHGIFEYCPLNDDGVPFSACVERLDKFKSAGLSMVVMPPLADADALNDYTKALAEKGLKIIWNVSNGCFLNDPAGDGAFDAYRALAEECGPRCETNADLLRFMVKKLAEYPVTHGFYAADDSLLDTQNREQVDKFVGRLKEHAGEKLVVFGGFGTEQLRQWVNTADLVVNELYPVAKDEVDWRTFEDQVHDAVKVTKENNRPQAFYLQAFSLGENPQTGEEMGVCSGADSVEECADKARYPTKDEQLKMRDIVLKNATPEVILWYRSSNVLGLAEGNDGQSIPAAGSPEADARLQQLKEVINAPVPKYDPPRAPRPTPPSNRRSTHTRASKTSQFFDEDW